MVLACFRGATHQFLCNRMTYYQYLLQVLLTKCLYCYTIPDTI
jgi:hypothetical protein